MIHSTAVIEKGAELASDVEIGPFCVVGPNVKLGKGTKLISHVRVEGWTQLGEYNTVFPFSVLGAVPQDLKYKGEKTLLTLGDRNVIREGVTLNLGTVQGGGLTKIGSDNLLMAYVHVGHDSYIGSNCILANYVGLAGHAVLEDYVTLGGMTGVAQFVCVGAHSYVGGQTGVEKDLPPFCIASGSRPCAIKGANIVGLRRRGYPAEVISKINEAIKLWVRSDTPKEQCLLEIESQYGEVPEIQKFISFIRGSKYGTIK
jgi:UDP-N-acetylglucosamine acyltransferase